MQTISFITGTSAHLRHKKQSRRHARTALFILLSGLSATTLATPFEIATGTNATGARTVTASETGKINQQPVLPVWTTPNLWSMD